MIDVEDTEQFVACDICNFGEETLGGGMVGSYAMCGNCIKDIKNPDELFDPTKTFRQNVLNYRQCVYGTSEGTIEFYGIEEFDNLDDFLKALCGG